MKNSILVSVLFLTLTASATEKVGDVVARCHSPGHYIAGVEVKVEEIAKDGISGVLNIKVTEENVGENGGTTDMNWKAYYNSSDLADLRAGKNVVLAGGKHPDAIAEGAYVNGVLLALGDFSKVSFKGDVHFITCTVQ